VRVIKVRVSKDGNAVGLTCILDRGQFVYDLNGYGGLYMF